MTPSRSDLVLSLLSRREEANGLGLALTRIPSCLFGPISLAIPSLEPSELGFLRFVSWLFVLFHESGLIGTRFLADKIAVFAPTETEQAEYLTLVTRLRTHLQHNLDPLSKRDVSIRVACEEWLATQCGTRIPNGEEQWGQCLTSLISQAERFLAVLVTVLRAIELDPNRETIISDWETRVTRYHPPHKFDELIPVVAQEMGRDHLDPLSFRRKHYDNWTSHLRLLSGEYDFDREARKLIEFELLTAVAVVMPLTGHDIQQEFDVPPGRDVGRLLELARKLYDQEPCSREVLIERLKSSENAGDTKS